MSHMQPQITDSQKWVIAETDVGTEYLPFWLSESTDPDAQYPYTMGTEITHTELIEGFGAQMSAPGYMACTPWVVFATEEAARAYLAEEHDLCPNCLEDLDQSKNDQPCPKCDFPYGDQS